MADKCIIIHYIHYELVVDSNTKEGEKPYKRMEKIKEDKTVDNFLKDFVGEFPKYARHKLENWFLSTVKAAATSPKSQSGNTVVSISDFAQKLKLSSKKETSEEYFLQKQIAIFGTVSTINVAGPDNNSQHHSLSQITSSENK